MFPNKKRRISVIFHLLPVHYMLQQDLVDKLNHHPFLEDEKKVTGGDLSHVLKSLEKDGIIERKPHEKPGRGSPGKISRLKITPEALIKVLKEFYNPELDRAGYFQRHLIISPYAQSIINIKLVKFIEVNISNLIKDKLNVTDFHFNSQEHELLLKILGTSPSALYYATVDYYLVLEKIINSRKKQLTHADDSIKEELKNKIISLIRQNFYLNLQLKLGEDLNNNIVKFNESIEYKISFKFLDDINKDQFWKLHCENNEIETIFLRNNY